MTFTTLDNNFSTARWIVNATAGLGTHTTIAAALTSAASGDTIFIMPGTYTENPTLKAGVNMCSYTCDAYTPNVTIIGKMSYSSSGTTSISGIQLKTNSDNLLSMTGSAASIVNLTNCYLNMSTTTGISNSVANSASQLNIFYCSADTGTTGIAYYSDSSTGSLSFFGCDFENKGASTTACTKSAGNITASFCIFKLSLTYSSSATGSSYANCNITCGATNSVGITTSGTGTFTIFNSRITSGTASAISIGSGTTVNCTNNTLNSSNTNVVTGVGSFKYGLIDYIGTSSTINPTTQTIAPASAFQQIVIQTFSANGTYTPTAGMKYCIIEIVGPGGGGGGSASTSGSQFGAAGGGGAGEYARGVFTSATIGTSQTVTCPAGGAGGTAGANDGTGGTTASVGAVITAGGGSGGKGCAASGTSQITLGGAGGTGGSGGSFRSNGNAGGFGLLSFVGVFNYQGLGGASTFGGQAVATNNAAGTAANGYGAGGNGGANSASGAARTGGNGSSGLVVITEYI